MILKLRQQHRRIILVLGVILPVAFVAGVAMRKPMSINVLLPRELAVAPQKNLTIEWERKDLFTNVPVQVRWLRKPGVVNDFAVELLADKHFVKPDVLVSWISETTVVGKNLPDDAVLLGGLNPSAPMRLPPNAVTGGALALYSLADLEIVGVSRPITLRKP